MQLCRRSVMPNIHRRATLLVTAVDELFGTQSLVGLARSDHPAQRRPRVAGMTSLFAS